MSQRSLAHSEAVTRAAAIRELSYELDFDLTLGEQVFRSVTTVRFSLVPDHPVPEGGIFLEVLPERLRGATLNGVPLDPESLSQGRLPLPGLAASNTVVVDGEFAYSHSSEGMHRFVDPVDGNVYVYAQPSITNAPTMMACFDQPDLKAPVTVTATGEPGWSMWANTAGRQVEPGRWAFPATKPLATYLITLLAGPFVEVRDEHDGIPLGIQARASYAETLRRDAPEIFEVTKACFDRFHELFGIRYPFGKYDQAFVPEFSWGAMEFPGMVVFRDESLFRAAVTDTERLERAAVIAHEMAHMWFGDLVTMRWWDDLWLNESFATYMGYRVTAEVTRWPQAWTRFAVKSKTWGYAADQRPSTHPVAPTDVADTDTAIANFDGISYAKGCSALRQLVAWIGDDGFFAGLRAHFDKHAWGNATLDDLLSALSAASGRDLDAWAQAWLRTPQVNTLRPVVEWNDDGSYARVAVAQTAPAEHPVLRPHHVNIGWQDADGGWRRTEAELTGALTEIPALTGVTGRGLLINEGDLTFAKIRVDDRTRAELAGLLAEQPDSLARALLWNSAWDAVRDGELPGEWFVELIGTALPAEPEVTVVESVLGLAQTAATRYVAPDRYDAALAVLHGACRDMLAIADAGSGRQLAAARGFIATASAQDGAVLRDWLDLADAPIGLLIDADLRWALLGRLAVLGDATEAQIDEELLRDSSARGQQEAVRARASRPDPAAKAHAFDLIVNEQGLSNRIVAAAGAGMWQPEHAALTESYVERFFTELPRSQGRSGDLLAMIAQAGYPGYAISARTVGFAERALAGEMHPLLRRAIADANDDLARALRAREG